jgi:hypothetical protein
MKRLCSVVTLMLLTTAAHAGTMYSFDVGGRTINIQVSSGCASLDCISLTRQAARHTGQRHASENKSIGKTARRNQPRPSIETAEQRSPNSLQPPSRVESALPKQAEISASRSTQAQSQALPIVPAEPASVTTVAAASPDQTGSSFSQTEIASTQAQSLDAVGTLPEAAATAPTSAITAPAIPASLPLAASADTKPSEPAPAEMTDAASSHPHPALAAASDATAAISTLKPLQKAPSSDAGPPARAYYAPHSPSSDVKPPALAYYTSTTPAAPRPSENKTSDHELSPFLEGNWLVEDRSSVRIKSCGPYLCGYASSTSSNETEEEMLIDLKPISSTEWVGMILNHDTGITYPAIVMLEGENALRVRSCGMGVTFCGGQLWSRGASVTAGR